MSETHIPFKWRLPVIRLLSAVLLLTAAGLHLKNRPQEPEEYETRVIPPTCEDSGYTLYTSIHTGSTEVRNLVPALGHSFGDWETIRSGTAVEPQLQSRVCSVCRAEDQQALYPELGIDRLTLNGDMEGIAKRDEVFPEAAFSGAQQSFTAFASAKYQGHSSLQYDKKNYTVKFFSDEDRKEKYRLTFSHWQPEHKYVLKAHYTDPSMCRNLVCADIWADMVSTRETVPQRLKELSNYGAVDGFPIALYINDTFHGLYTMNLHKDERLFNLRDGAREAVMNINSADAPEAFFREEAVFDEEMPWEIERCATEDTQWAQDHLNDLIRFVRTSDDLSFRRELSRYLDVDSAVDYVIAMYALGLQEHGAKDLVLVSYGEDAPWICSMYDMEEAFDLDGGVCAPGEGGWDSGTGSLLWDRFLTHFYPEICSRYAQLRQGVLDPDSLCSRVDAFVGRIPRSIYEADAKTNGVSVHTPEQTQLIKENIRQLIQQTDIVFFP